MFHDRKDAAQQLASKLQQYKDHPDVVIVAIPRGALEIGEVLATELKAPLDVVFVKKIGAPGNPELAIGTISMNQIRLAPGYYGEPVDDEYIEQQTIKLRTLLQERINTYQEVRPQVDLRNKIVILTDDGVATGNTFLLALDEVKEQEPKKIVVAMPIGPTDVMHKMKKEVDEVICLNESPGFMGISQFYRAFPQIEDSQAIEILRRVNR